MSRAGSFALLCVLLSVMILAYLVWLAGGELELVGGRLDALELDSRRHDQELVQVATRKPRTRKAAPSGGDESGT